MTAGTQDPSAPPRSDRRLHVPDVPNWAPLQRLIGLSRCPQFMAMGEITQDGITICLYKHIRTRHYLNLDALGGTYYFTGDRYEPIDRPKVLHHVFT